MALSDDLQLQAGQEENDWKAWSLHYKADREKRWEKFVSDLLPKIQASEKVQEVEQFPNFFFRITFLDGLKIDIYPKKNRVKVIKQDRWFYDGVNFVLERV